MAVTRRSTRLASAKSRRERGGGVSKTSGRNGRAARVTRASRRRNLRNASKGGADDNFNIDDYLNFDAEDGEASNGGENVVFDEAAIREALDNDAQAVSYDASQLGEFDNNAQVVNYEQAGINYAQAGFGGDGIGGFDDLDQYLLRTDPKGWEVLERCEVPECGLDVYEGSYFPHYDYDTTQDQWFVYVNTQNAVGQTVDETNFNVFPYMFIESWGPSPVVFRLRPGSQLIPGTWLSNEQRPPPFPMVMDLVPFSQSIACGVQNVLWGLDGNHQSDGQSPLMQFYMQVNSKFAEVVKAAEAAAAVNAQTATIGNDATGPQAQGYRGELGPVDASLQSAQEASSGQEGSRDQAVALAVAQGLIAAGQEGEEAYDEQDLPLAQKTKCHGCRDNEEVISGQPWYKPCNWVKQGSNYIGCTNCANYRHDFDSTHECKAPKLSKSFVFMRHANGDARDYNSAVCGRCAAYPSMRATCDADPVIDIGCTSCQKGLDLPEGPKEEKGGRKNAQKVKACICSFSVPAPEEGVGAVRVERDATLRPRPLVQKSKYSWFRHSCDACKNELNHRSNAVSCTWLLDRSLSRWACGRCVSKGTVCEDSGRPKDAHPAAGPPAAASTNAAATNAAATNAAAPVNAPSQPELENNMSQLSVQPPSIESGPLQPGQPARWTTDATVAGDRKDLKDTGAGRRRCRVCREGNNKCRPSAATAAVDTACPRCAQSGLDCEAQTRPDQTYYPLFDLSQVGVGQFCAFAACRRCIDQGRNCDRQRPCDSCHGADEDALCDAFNPNGTPEQQDESRNCISRRATPLGPLYYMAMGYGSGGVNDPKTNQKMEDWVGPPMPIYALGFRNDDVTRETNKQAVSQVFSRYRVRMHPQGPPPWASPDGKLRTLRPSQMGRKLIRALIMDSWKGLMRDPMQCEDFMPQVMELRKIRNDVRASGTLQRAVHAPPPNQENARRPIMPPRAGTSGHDDDVDDEDV